ncbi:DUF1194 domain-containing protein [Mesorhizobium sp. CN2-181]|uniref:DUF1194 domain-containing protein n=1 Tax=Mesorhizobium yinganensis TaxID=3157707 RepID=UPI0032B70CBA
MLSLLGVLFCLGCDVRPVATAMPADVELVLAVDVSRSMDADEFALQRAGYVEAIRHPDFINAVRAGRNGRIAIAYFEWAGTVRRESLVPWQVIDSPESAQAFAAALAGRPFGGYTGTSISGALDFGNGLFDDNSVDGLRRVIDVSGDGPNNIGLPVTGARDRAVAAGIIVNGLPIIIRPSPTFSELDRYYAECVIGGEGSFMLPIRSVDEFATAIRRKLILEVSGATPPAIVIPAAGEPVDCLKGERDRRFFSDPYFPELDR